MKPKTEKISANYGTCIHAGVGAYYGNQGLSLEERICLAIKAFTEEWEQYGHQGTEKYSLLGGVETLKAYCTAYQRDSFDFIPELIECSQSLEMPNGTVLIGRIDRVARTGDSVTVVDTKTTSMSFTDYYFRQYENCFQISAYYYIVNTILSGAVDCAVIDCIKVPYSTGKSRKTGEPVENFVRRSFMRTPLQLAEFVNTYNTITGEILEALASGKDAAKFPQCPTACSNYGGCEYLPVCKYGFSHPTVKLDFEEVEDEGK